MGKNEHFWEATEIFAYLSNVPNGVVKIVYLTKNIVGRGFTPSEKLFMNLKE